MANGTARCGYANGSPRSAEGSGVLATGRLGDHFRPHLMRGITESRYNPLDAIRSWHQDLSAVASTPLLQRQAQIVIDCPLIGDKRCEVSMPGAGKDGGVAYGLMIWSPRAEFEDLGRSVCVSPVRDLKSEIWNRACRRPCAYLWRRPCGSGCDGCDADYKSLWWRGGCVDRLMPWMPWTAKSEVGVECDLCAIH